jgi:GTP-binding protein
LIENAHQGAGLGDRFLAHIERCRVLLHLVDGLTPDAGAAYRLVRRELKAYGHGLTDKPELVALTKADVLTEDMIDRQRRRLARAIAARSTDADRRRAPRVISAATGAGLEVLLRGLVTELDQAREPAVAATTPAWQP